MQTEKIVKDYLRVLEDRSYKNIIKFFTSDTIIISPLYGKVKAEDFYRELFKDTSKFTITLLNIFKNSKNSNIVAAHFHNNWILKNGTPAPFECINIFRFSEAKKIKELIIIYDIAKIRSSFNEVKK